MNNKRKFSPGREQDYYGPDRTRKIKHNILKTTDLYLKIYRRLLFFILILGMFPVVLGARLQGSVYPREMLAERISRIAEDYSARIAFDNNLIARIEVSALDVGSLTLEEALEKSLNATDFIYKKLPNETYAIARRIDQPVKGTGSLKGRIVEAETSEPLPGATVLISGTQFGTTSDADGYYLLEKVPAGKYTIEVSFIGYMKERVDVRVQASGTATYDVKLSGDSRQIDEVVVSGIRREKGSVPHTTERIIVQEIKSLQAVASGISSEQISKSADRNAAEVVKKISGVSIRDDKFIVVRGMNERYNLTYLNGNVAPSTELYSRAFALNLLPTRIIDKILVFKSPSPDMLGDMAGGAVKIYTKDAVNVKHFDVEFTLGVRPNTAFSNNFLTYKGSKTDFLGFDDGLRKLPSTMPGFGDFTKAKISQQQYAESFSNILSPSKMSVLPDFTFTANYYNAFLLGSHTLSMLSSFSYKNEKNSYDADRIQSSFKSDNRTHNIISETQSTETAQLTWLQNFTLTWNERSKLRFKNFLLQQGQKSTVYRTSLNNLVYTDYDYESWGYPPGWGWKPWLSIGTDERNIILGYTQRFLYSGNLSGEHQLDKSGRHQLNWNIGYIYSLQTIPDQRIIRLKNSVIGDYLSIPDPAGAHWTAAVRGLNYGTEEGGSYDVTKGIISRTWMQNSENSYDASIDYVFKFTAWLSFKAGTYQQWKERVLFRRVYTVNEGDVPASGYPSQAIIGGGVGGYMDFDRILFKEQDLSKVWSAEYLKDDGSALKVIDRTSGSDAYTATEQNNSGYIAAALTPFGGKLEIYGGVRAEYNRQKVAGAIPERESTGGGLSVPILVDIHRLVWLPSLNISYKPAESWVFRGAYGKTVNRPEFRELSPYSELDYLNNQSITGNPDLVPSDITGYDLRAEWYPGKSQSNTFSAGAFYKEINKPIERTVSRGLRFNRPAEISFANAEEAAVSGLEIDVRQGFDFLPVPVVRNLGVVANYSLMDSEVKQLFKTNASGSNEYKEVKRQLQGQAPYMLNAGLYYDNAGSGTKAALIYNEIGPRIYAAAYGLSFAEANEGTQYRQAGNAGSILELKRRQLDFSLTQRIIKGLQLKLSVQNLLNEAVQMAEDENFTYKYEPAVEYNKDGGDGDLISNSYKTDRFFNLTVTYSF
ncbi:MAG: TonB-dependent receptor domain-containing protein [Mangrovibacterium sp.]